MSWLSWITQVLTLLLPQFPTRPFHLEHQFECRLVLQRSLFVRQAQTFPRQAHVETGGFCDFHGGLAGGPP